MSVFNKNTRRVLSYDVLRQQKTGVMTNGGLTSLRLRRITSSPSQTLRRPLVRTTDDGRRGECSTLAAVRRGFVFHSSRLTITCMQRSEIFVQNRVFAYTPPAFDAPVRGVPVQIWSCRLLWKN